VRSSDTIVFRHCLNTQYIGTYQSMESVKKKHVVGGYEPVLMAELEDGEVSTLKASFARPLPHHHQHQQPSSFVRKHSWKLLLVLVVVGLVTIDVATLWNSLHHPRLERVDISLLESEAHIDLTAHVSSRSLTMDLKSHGVTCDHFYRPSRDADWSRGGQFLVSFPEETTSTAANDDNHYLPNDGNEHPESSLRAVIHTRDSHFPVLRQILWDLSPAAAGVEAQMQVSCAVDTELTLFHLFPLRRTLAVNRILSLSDIQTTIHSSLATKRKSGASESDMVDKDAQLLHHWLQPVSSTVTEFSRTNIEYEFSFQLLHESPALQAMSSFTLHLPPLSFFTTLISNHDTSSSDSLLFHSSSLTAELTSREPLTLSVGVSCGHPGNEVDSKGDLEEEEEDEEGVEEVPPTCDLFTSTNLHSFSTEWKTRKFLNMTMQANADNFLMSLLGHAHYIRSVENTHFSQSPTHQHKIEANRRLLAIPHIVTDANCVTIDGDGAWMVQACEEILRDSYQVHLGVNTNNNNNYNYDNNQATNHLATISSMTSWPPSAAVGQSGVGLSFDSRLEGSLMINAVEYIVRGDLSYSEPEQRFQTDVAFNVSTFPILHERLAAKWAHLPDGTTVFDTESTLTIASNDTMIHTLGHASFGNNTFQSSLWIDLAPDVVVIESVGNIVATFDNW
jgi:hypothetical protein